MPFAAVYTGADCLKKAKEDSTEDSTYGLSDDEFQRWFAERLASHPLMEDYPRIQHLASKAVTRWRQRFRGNIQLWRKLFKGERVVKEIIEAAPVIDATINIVENLPEGNGQKFTLIDLASGRGYISMILSEVLPPQKVEKIYLIDKAWPLSGTVDALPHQISWEHLYGNRPEEQGGGCYYDSWPIPMHTSKQDLKQRCTRRQLRRAIFDKCQGPVLILAVHLCGTLSLRAVEMFNDYPEKVKYLALKPCCLPPIVHVKKKQIFSVGGHSFSAKAVCSSGRFKNNVWHGPPRSKLGKKFHVWSEHLFRCINLQHAADDQTAEVDMPPPKMDMAESDTIDKEDLQCVVCSLDEASISREVFLEDELGSKTKLWKRVQLDSGYQNTYIFADRLPLTPAVWGNAGSNSASHDT